MKVEGPAGRGSRRLQALPRSHMNVCGTDDNGQRQRSMEEPAELAGGVDKGQSGTSLGFWISGSGLVN